jgi:hypothetical protein
VRPEAIAEIISPRTAQPAEARGGRQPIGHSHDVEVALLLRGGRRRDAGAAADTRLSSLAGVRIGPRQTLACPCEAEPTLRRYAQDGPTQTEPEDRGVAGSLPAEAIHEGARKTAARVKRRDPRRRPLHVLRSRLRRGAGERCTLLDRRPPRAGADPGAVPAARVLRGAYVGWRCQRGPTADSYTSAHRSCRTGRASPPKAWRGAPPATAARHGVHGGRPPPRSRGSAARLPASTRVQRAEEKIGGRVKTAVEPKPASQDGGDVIGNVLRLNQNVDPDGQPRSQRGTRSSTSDTSALTTS